MINKDLQYYKFCWYGFLKNLRFFDPFIILFFRSVGFSFLQIGLLFSIREIATGILEIPTGFFADSYGRKLSMILAFSSYIISFLIFYFLPGFGFYALAMILFACGEAFRSGTHKAMILDYLTIHDDLNMKVAYYGHTRGASKLGSAISALIAGLLVFFSEQYKIVFIASVIPYILGLLLMISYPDELNGEVSKIEKTSFLKSVVRNLRITVSNFITMFKNPMLLRAFFNSASFDGLFKSVKDYLQPILNSFALALPIFISLGEKRSTIIIAITYFLIYLISAYSSRQAQEFTLRFKSVTHAINGSYIIGVSAVIIAGVATNFDVRIIAIILFIVLYALQNLRRPMNVGFISENINAKIMATGLSVETQLKTIYIAILSPILGFFSDKFGVGIGLAITGCLVGMGYSFVKVAEKKK
ncbi:MAG TPA: MFS transporter [Candidatus Cloacimonetes bacterium]|nr:MFS transporter [Candidatus Cloacimonadota bacterium]HEX37535.1 MFS transporter [Candidatus Cloacimonadota bacterium]